jgi:hypothetical protein
MPRRYIKGKVRITFQLIRHLEHHVRIKLSVVNGGTLEHSILVSCWIVLRLGAVFSYLASALGTASDDVLASGTLLGVLGESY